MRSRGAVTVQPLRRLRLAAILGVVWVAFLIALAGWWTSILMRQSARIAQLELATGAAESAVDERWATARRMLVWESSTFILLLLVLSCLLFWLYWREYLRTRATQAFFAAVTHELRTPLTSVRLQAEALAHPMAQGQPTAELTRRLLDDTHRLESQIDKTLELARLEGGGMLAEQAIPLAAWLPRIVDSIAATHGERLTVSTVVAEQLPPIRGDAAAVQMILRNVLENSVRHGRRDQGAARLHIEASPHAGGVQVLCRDEGPMDARTLPANLGKLFQRGGASSGTGVGLYLVRVLMDRMGGKAEYVADVNGFQTRLLFQPSPDDSL